MNKDNWAEDFIPPVELDKEPQSYTPSHLAVPHWAEEKPSWAISEEEFWRSQVAGQLIRMHELKTKEKITFRYPQSHLGRAIQAWINSEGPLPTFTNEQLTHAESKVLQLRQEGAIPSSFSQFARKLDAQAIQFSKENPKKTLPNYKPSISFREFRTRRDNP